MIKLHVTAKLGAMIMVFTHEGYHDGTGNYRSIKRGETGAGYLAAGSDYQP